MILLRQKSKIRFILQLNHYPGQAATVVNDRIFPVYGRI
jgi:hypothetical protein